MTPSWVSQEPPLWQADGCPHSPPPPPLPTEPTIEVRDEEGLAAMEEINALLYLEVYESY